MERQVQRVREGLQPKLGTGAAANGERAWQTGAGGYQRLKAVAERKPDALHHRLAEHFVIGRPRHADEGGARIHIVMRGSFAGQVRQEQDG